MFILFGSKKNLFSQSVALLDKKKIPIFEIVMQNYFEKALFGATTLSITTLSAMTFSIVLNKARKILMLSVTYKTFILTVIRLNVIMLSVVAPFIFV